MKAATGCEAVEQVEPKTAEEELRSRLRTIAKRRTEGSALLAQGRSSIAVSQRKLYASVTVPSSRSTEALNGGAAKEDTTTALTAGDATGGGSGEPSGMGSPRESIDGSRAVDADQMQELRTQIAAFQQHLKGGKSAPPSGEVTSRDPEPERTGRQGSRPSSGQQLAGPTTGPLENELVWIVREMDLHRKKIQHHQEQLSSLEKRHAELLMAHASKTQSLEGGRNSPVGSMSEFQSYLPVNSPGPQLCHSLGGIGDEPSLLHNPEDSSSAYANALAAGARLHNSRPGSPTASTISASSGVPGRAHRDSLLSSMPARPLSASSTQSAGSRRGPNANSLKVSPGAFSGITRRTSSHLSDDFDENTLSSTDATEVVALLHQYGLRRPLRVPFVPLGRDQHDISDTYGMPFLYGSLEVRLLLSDDHSRLCVRVAGNPNGRLFDMDEFVARAEAIEKKAQRPNPIEEESEVYDVGPPMSLLDGALFGTSGGPRKGSVTIPSSLGGTPSSLTGMSAAMTGGTPSAVSTPLRSLLGSGGGIGGGEKLPTKSPTSAQPWKELFKSHWGSR